MVSNHDTVVAELVTLTIKEVYVYAPLPPCVTVGHRADDWNPEQWSKAVLLKFVTCRNDAGVRLEDQVTGELFAECPLPNDGVSLTTPYAPHEQMSYTVLPHNCPPQAVEPVTDSSRYFVLRIVDRVSRNHAFIGIGFRDRSEASHFTAELDNYRQFLRRKGEAEHMRKQYESQQLVFGGADNSNDEDESSDNPAAVRRDLSLPPGQTITLNLPGAVKRPLDKPGFLSRLTSAGSPVPAQAASAGAAASTSGLSSIPPVPSPAAAVRLMADNTSRPGLAPSASSSVVIDAARAVAGQYHDRGVLLAAEQAGIGVDVPRQSVTGVVSADDDDFGPFRGA